MKKPHKSPACATLLAALLLVPAPLRAAETEADGEPSLYRYRNDKGVQVINFNLPPEYASKGYDIVSPSGRLIKHVPPSTERPAMSAEDIKAQEEQKKEDAYILRSYSTLADISRARQRKLDMVAREMDIIKGNIADYARREMELKEKAAGYQASGQQPPESITQVIKELAEQQENAHKQMEERRAEYQAVMTKFDRQAERLKALRPELEEKTP
jgi:hypothetical protein